MGAVVAWNAVVVRGLATINNGNRRNFFGRSQVIHHQDPAIFDMSSVDDVDKSLWKEHLFIVHDLTGACKVGARPL